MGKKFREKIISSNSFQSLRGFHYYWYSALENIEAMKSKIKALGEIALRVENLESMTGFYENVVGLELMKRFENMTFSTSQKAIKDIRKF